MAYKTEDADHSEYFHFDGLFARVDRGTVSADTAIGGILGLPRVRADSVRGTEERNSDLE
jgi:hypothetical protein